MGFLTSSIGRKIVMSVTGLFLISFLIVHLSINLLTLVSKEAFNEAAHFMATNPIIQVMQYVLALGFIFGSKGYYCFFWRYYRICRWVLPALAYGWNRVLPTTTATTTR